MLHPPPSLLLPTSERQRRATPPFRENRSGGRGCEKIHHNDRGYIPAVIAAAPRATCSALAEGMDRKKKEKKGRTLRKCLKAEYLKAAISAVNAVYLADAAEADGGAVES